MKSTACDTYEILYEAKRNYKLKEDDEVLIQQDNHGNNTLM